MVPLVRFELTYYTPLFERGDFTKFVHRGKKYWLPIPAQGFGTCGSLIAHQALTCFRRGPGLTLPVSIYALVPQEIKVSL
jgi:hypothetical protein